MNQVLPQHLAQFGAHRGDGRMRFAALLRQNRFALLGTLLFAIVIPELLHPFFARSYEWAHILIPSEPELFTCVVALLAVQVGLRKVSSLPSVNDKLVILPVFLTVYAMAVVVLSVSIGNYGRYHLVTSFAIGAAWCYLVAVMRGRFNQPRLALAGDVVLDEELLDSRIRWIQLNRPRLPRNVQGIVFDSEIDASPEWERLFARAVLRNVPVYDLSQLREMMTGQVRLRGRPELIFGQLMPSLPYLRLKRLIDTFAAVPALLLALPVIMVAALLIRIESPGRALFVQRRMGYQGRTFNCYKLRSMRSDLAGPAFTAEQDPRITRVGRFIRKWRIDELPQIVNILKGEMSFIGPRPEALNLSRDYQRAIPYYAYRHAVRPGITGWAAVRQGNVALTEAVTKKLEFDFYYIKYFSIWLDALIVLLTLRTIVTGFGSR